MKSYLNQRISYNMNLNSRFISNVAFYLDVKKVKILKVCKSLGFGHKDYEIF